jgi:ligand-binding sensor domain-containing protein
MKINKTGHPSAYTGLNRLRLVFMLCFLFLAAPARLFAQDIENLRIDKVQDEGLTCNRILCISQDNSGFIWMGTGEGLFRYDGYTFKAFKNFLGNPATIAANIIASLYPEGNKLWVGTSEGLSYIDIGTQTVKNIPGPGHFAVQRIVRENDSVFWAGTSAGLFRFNINNSRWTKIPLNSKETAITSLCDDKKGDLYITSKSYLFCYNKLTGNVKSYLNNLHAYPLVDKSLRPIYQDSQIGNDGNVWLGTWAGGLAEFNPLTKKFKQWWHPTDNLNAIPYKIAMALLADKNGNIWIANKEGGLTIFNPAKNKFTNYPVQWRSDNTISGALISLFRDKSGIVWIGTENGAYKCDPHSASLLKTDMMLKTDTGSIQANISPLVILNGTDGTKWMGMYEGLFIFDAKTNTLYNQNKEFGLPQYLPVFNIIQDADGATWFTAKQLLVKVTKNTGNKTHPYHAEIYQSAEVTSAITSLYIDKEKRMWVGTVRNGIFRFDTTSKIFIPYRNGLSGNITYINTLCELSKDSMLIGSAYAGLILLHTNTGRFEKIRWANTPANVIIYSIYREGNNLWLATDYGLWGTNCQFKNPLVVTIDDGLPSMNVGALAYDNRGTLWLLTSAGVVSYRISDRKISTFDRKDGIQSLDHTYALINDGNNNIILGARGCFYTFKPSQMVRNTVPPKVFITGLRVFDKEYNADRGQPIELNYKQNYFSLDYVALNYTHSRLNKYAYKMDGLDKKWNDAGSRRYVSYANLEEGTYTFNVKACNNEGVWNNIPAKLVIIISPPFWHRWWFYLLVFVFFAGIVYTLYTYNINQLKMRLQLRDKIARDLHDDIGSTLSGINIFSKIALQNLGSDRKSSRELL